MIRRTIQIVALLMFALALTAGEAEKKAAPKSAKQVICVLCGDYTFSESDATAAVFQGKHIHLCSLKELEMLKAKPDDYVWATDPVSGKKVNKIHTGFAADHRVQVKKKDGKLEVWPRRFFFESQTTRDEFVKNPAKYLKEPYAV